MRGEPAQVTLYYDCLSPFSYFAFTALHRYAILQLWPMQLELKPMLLGGVMAATGNRPPAVREWAGATTVVASQDMARNREWFNLPAMLEGPSNFFGPDGPTDKRGLARDMRYQRLLTAIRIRYPHRPEVLREATRLTFELIWASSVDRNTEDAVVITKRVLERIATQAGLVAEEAANVVQQITASGAWAFREGCRWHCSGPTRGGVDRPALLARLTRARISSDARS